MFRDWENLYLLVGGAAGALIGIMFVVATLTAGLDPGRVSRGSQIYVTPIVFHFAVVMVVSVLTAVLGLPPPTSGAVIALCAAVGIAYTVTTTIRLLQLDWEEQLPDWSDKSFYGILPTMAYVGFAAAAGDRSHAASPRSLTSLEGALIAASIGGFLPLQYQRGSCALSLLRRGERTASIWPSFVKPQFRRDVACSGSGRARPASIRSSAEPQRE
jgi:hypothetical protein